jgi:hypothetical protein
MEYNNLCHGICYDFLVKFIFFEFSLIVPILSGRKRLRFDLSLAQLNPSLFVIVIFEDFNHQ